MAVPAIKINLIMPKPIWRTHHILISWFTLVLGCLILVSVAILMFRLNAKASLFEKKIKNATSTFSDVDWMENQIGDTLELRELDVTKELPIWQLAERIYFERYVTWSRITEEIERSLVPGVRITSIRRSSFSGNAIKIEIVGEALSRMTEATFMGLLKKNRFFNQVIIEKESERQGGGVLFAYIINITPITSSLGLYPGHNFSLEVNIIDNKREIG